MPNALVRIILFTSSYAPLVVIFGVQAFENFRSLSLALFSFAALATLALFGFLKVAKSLNHQSIEIESIVSKDGEVMSYVVSYILPFLQINWTKWEDAFALLVFFVIIAVLYINSSMIYINPVLNIFGYHIFEVVTKDGHTLSVISKRKYLSKKKPAKIVKIGNFVALEK